MDLLFFDSTDSGYALAELLDPIKYRGYLQVMSHFSGYSWHNIFLIFNQMPHATKLADFKRWKEQYGRTVIKGSKTIIIYAPIEQKPTKKLVEKTDPLTGAVVYDENGKKVMIEVFLDSPVQFKPVNLLDISQTVGKPVLRLAGDVMSDKSLYKAFIDILQSMSQLALYDENNTPTPMDIYDAVKKTANERLGSLDNPGSEKVGFVAECISYVVCRRFGLEVDFIELDTVKGKIDENMLETIGKHSDSLITLIEDRFAAICKERSIEPMTLPKTFVDKPSPDNETEPKAKPPTEAPVKPKTEPQYTKELQTEVIAGVNFNQYTVKPLHLTDNPITETKNVEVSGTEHPAQLPPIETAPPSSTVPPKKTKPAEPPINKHPPDKSITITGRNQYGYTRPELLPLRKERAINLFNRDMAIYLLYRDNTEALAYCISDINNHEGLFGIPYIKWQASREHIAIASGNPEAIKESEFTHGNGDSFAIYQIKPGNSLLEYKSYEEIQESELFIDRQNYKLVYTAQLPTPPADTPAGIFMWLNAERPKDYEGRTVAISDVLSIKKDGVITSHYANGRTFKELISFNGEEGRISRQRKKFETVENAFDVPERADINDKLEKQEGTPPLTSLNEQDISVSTDLGQPSQTTLQAGQTVLPSTETSKEPPKASDMSQSTTELATAAEPALPVNRADSPLYKLSKQEAEEHGVLELYTLSRRINFDCAKAIDEAIETHRKGKNRYDLETPASFLLKKYGTERVLWVMNLHVKAKPKGLSQENVIWVNDSLGVGNEEKPYLFLRTHNAVLDAFINRLRVILGKKPRFAELIKMAKKKSDEHNKLNS